MNTNRLEGRLFRFSMWWRIVYGIFRTILGCILLRLIDVPFVDILHHISKHELKQDPTDTLFYFLNTFLLAHPFKVTTFIAAYMIFWGVMDIVLSVCLLRHYLPAFPISIGLIGIFVTYELFRLTHTHSAILLTFIIIDTVIAWLIYREYNKVRRYFTLKESET